VEFFVVTAGHRQFAFDGRMGIIPFEGYVLGAEVVKVFDGVRNLNRREGFWFPRELLACLFQVVFVDVNVAEGMGEFAGFKICHFREDVEEKGVACNIKRNSEEDIGGSLIELEAKPAVFDV